MSERDHVETLAVIGGLHAIAEAIGFVIYLIG